MLDLTLFRKPAFNGVSAVAFGLSAGMFALFLYLTIYMQGVLDYSPLETGLRFLPLTVLSFIASPIAGKLSEPRPDPSAARQSASGPVGLGLLLMHGLSPDSSVSALLPRLPDRRHRHRHCQSRHRPSRDRSRAGREGGDGIRDQHHLPPGRHRHWRRLAGGDLPVPGRLEALANCCPIARMALPRSSPPAALALPPRLRLRVRSTRSSRPPKPPSSAASTRSS